MVDEERDQWADFCLHARTATMLAELSVGFEAFLTFAGLIGVIIDKERSSRLMNRHYAALTALAEAQNRRQRLSDPLDQFFDLLADAIATKAAHVAGIGGTAPHPKAFALGWEDVRIPVNTNNAITAEPDKQPAKVETADSNDDAGNYVTTFRPKGVRIGWIDDTNLYLSATKSLEVARGCAHRVGVPLNLSIKTLGETLDQRGLLLSRENLRRRTARPMIEGSQKRVLHIHRKHVVPLLMGQTDFDDPDYVGPPIYEVLEA